MVDTWVPIALVIGILIGVALIYLINTRKLEGKTLESISTMLEALPFPAEDSVFGLIAKYAKTAVLTVEQMVEQGKIPKNNESRKSTAMDIVKTAAAVDGIEFGKNESMLASSCIEAEVHELPRKHIKSAVIPALMALEEELAEETEDEDMDAPEEDPEESQEEIPEEIPEEAAPAEETSAEDEAPGVTEAPPDEADGANE